MWPRVARASCSPGSRRRACGESPGACSFAGHMKGSTQACPPGCPAGAWDTTTHPHGSSHTRVHVKALEGAPSTVSTQRLRGLCKRWGEGPIVHLPQDFCPPGGRSLTGEPCHSPWGPSPCMPEAGGFSSPAPRDQHLPNCTPSSRLCCPARRPSQQPCKELALPPPPSLRMASGVTAEGRGNPLCADTLWAAGSNLA